MKYNEKVLEEFFNPQNVGVIKGASGKGKVVSQIDKEIVKLYIMVEGRKIAEATFQAFGCTATIACCSAATRLIKGKTLAEAEAVTAADIEKELGSLPSDKKHSAALAEQVIKAAVKNVGKKSAASDDDED